MANSPEAHINQPMPSDTTSGGEDEIFHNIIREIDRLPDGVQRVDFHLGDDSTGAPAVWFTFIAHDDLKPSKEKIAAFQCVADVVRSKVFSRSERWPYVEIVTE
jgi:hypothetical protein